MKRRAPGFTLIEMLIVAAIVIALAAIAVTLSKSSKEKANQVTTLAKMKSLGSAFSTYTAEKNGLLPFEDCAGTDDWTAAAKPENQEVWYNALPKLMGSPSVGDLGATSPERFYDDSYPLYVPGAKYPGRSGRLGSPTFAVGINSRLQRKSEEGVKKQGLFSQIMNPVKTVIFLERGMPNDKQSMPAQRGFDGSPKANARAFAARHNQKGILVFADGHAEARPVSDLITKAGSIIFPQNSIVWTLDPDLDPN